jgi:hypothetical protein
MESLKLCQDRKWLRPDLTGATMQPPKSDGVLVTSQDAMAIPVVLGGTGSPTTGTKSPSRHQADHRTTVSG